MADTIQRAAARVIDAWDSTVLPVANDGRLQEAMEDLRAAMAAMADTPTLREAAQQALEALAPLANATTPAEREALTDEDSQAADAASCDLRAALAEQAEPVCQCGDRPKSQCPEPWEIGCDLGNNEKYVRVAAPPAPARQEPLTVTRQLEAVGRVAEVHMSRYTVEWLDRPYPSGTVLYADIIEAAMNGPRRRREQHALPAAPITAAPAEGGAA